MTILIIGLAFVNSCGFIGLDTSSKTFTFINKTNSSVIVRIEAPEAFVEIGANSKKDVKIENFPEYIGTAGLRITGYFVNTNQVIDFDDKTYGNTLENYFIYVIEPNYKYIALKDYVSVFNAETEKYEEQKLYNVSFLDKNKDSVYYNKSNKGGGEYLFRFGSDVENPKYISYMTDMGSYLAEINVSGKAGYSVLYELGENKAKLINNFYISTVEL